MPEPTKPGVVAETVPAQQQPVPVVASVESAVPQAQPVQTVSQPAQVLPGEASGRTKEQFDKLLESNRRMSENVEKLFEVNELLRQESLRRGESSQTFQPIQAVRQPVQQQVNPNDFIEVDANGEKFLNEAKLQEAVRSINERASRAESTVQSYIQAAQDRETAREEKEAYSIYPELDPKSAQFDIRFADFTRAVIQDSLINPQQYGGRNLSFKEAGDLVTSRTAKQQPVVVNEPIAQPKPAVAVSEATQEVKEQASLAAVSQPQGQPKPQVYNLADLREMTRVGKGTDGDRAIAIRLQNVDHVRTAEEA